MSEDNEDFSELDTLTPLHGLYDELNSNSADRLTPSFFVFENNAVKKYEIDEDSLVFKIGSSEECDIVLSDPTVGEVQVSTIILGEDCYFMDCGGKDVVQFEGVKRRQLITPAESRVIIRVGDTWIVYVGIDFHKYDETDSVLLRRSLLLDTLQESHGEILLKLGDQESFSSTKPILCGSHNACDFKIDSLEVCPFHFMVYFSPGGVYLEDLTNNKPGLRLNASQVKRPMPLSEDSLIQLGSLKIYFYIYDNVSYQCKKVFGNMNRKPGLVMTHLRNPENSIELPQSSRRMSIGRDDECDIVLDDNSASRVHAFIMSRDKYLLVQDNDSSNQTFINLEPVKKATLRPGDLIEMGDSCFLLHYKL